MKIKEKLTKEIITYILSNLGFVSKPLFGKSGLSEDFYKSNKMFTIKTDNETVQVSVYSAISNLEGSKLQIAGIALPCDSDLEFAIAVRLDENKIYGIKQISDNEDVGLFVVSMDGKEWRQASMSEKLMLCLGFEQFVDFGLNWIPESNFTELYNALQEIIEL